MELGKLLRFLSRNSDIFKILSKMIQTLTINFEALIWKFLFIFKGELVTQNMSSGIIISTHSLVLQSVTRKQSGDYSCVASNSRGERAGAPVRLKVRCKSIHYSFTTASCLILEFQDFKKKSTRIWESMFIKNFVLKAIKEKPVKFIVQGAEFSIDTF